MENLDDTSSGDILEDHDAMDQIGEAMGQEAVAQTGITAKPLSKRRVESYNESLKKRGVVYLSRVPPFMKPAKVKHLMEQHGVVTRVSGMMIFICFRSTQFPSSSERHYNCLQCPCATFWNLIQTFILNLVFKITSSFENG